MAYRNKKITNGARDEPCTNCGWRGTTVAAHSNALAHGHGSRLKVPDYYVAYVCHKCHDLIDGRAGKLTKQEKRSLWDKCWKLTVPIYFEKLSLTEKKELWRIFFEEGIIK